jgi:hypothetical protein
MGWRVRFKTLPIIDQMWNFKKFLE